VIAALRSEHNVTLSAVRIDGSALELRSHLVMTH
jgi:hypothetical protein